MIFTATMWDDGLVSDLRLMDILRSMNLTANFAISPARHSKYRKANDSRGAYGELVSIDELKEFSAFEISNHTANHKELIGLSESETKNEIRLGRSLLEDIYERKIQGFCWPYGKYDNLSVNILKQDKYSYARTTNSGRKNDKSLVIHPTAKWNWDYDRFISSASTTGQLVIWGHTYELTTNKDWDQIKTLYGRLQTDPRIKMVSFQELINQRKLKHV